MRRALLLVACAVLVVPSAAHATFPGQNGKIAFAGAGSVETINPDGTGRTSLGAGGSPDWSPDGGKIAFVKLDGPPPGPCCRQASSIFTMLADGSNQTEVVNGDVIQWNESEDWGDPAWSPDGSRLAVSLTQCDSSGGCGVSIHHAPATGPLAYPTWISWSGSSPAWRPYSDELAYIFISYLSPGGLRGVRANASNNHVIWSELSDPQYNVEWPVEGADYSPLGNPIVFATPYPDGGDFEIQTVPATGGEPLALTQNSANDTDPVWSPDGKKIAFVSNRDGNYEIYTMNADGTNQTRITNTPGNENAPSWQPLPYPGYARPKGATPMRVSLVPAFRQCTAPDRQHGPPLAYGSCSAPAQESDELTVGSAPVNMSGSVRYETILGIPSTPADEADIALHVQITDVREQNTLADYAGEVEAQATARLTDRTASGGDPATATNMLFPLTTPCSPTADPNVGSTCSLTTTLDTLIPGAIEEGQRTVLQLSQVQVIDGGADGDTATQPNTVFLRQGVFVP